MLRSVRFAQAQENALGILAYADAFEKHIAKQLRNMKGHTFIPTYDSSELKSSITWTLESKRRLRIQQNVAAAALPAITFAAMLLANAITPQSTGDGSGIVYSLVSIIREHQLLLVALYVAAIYFVLSITGIAPSPRRLWIIRIIVQLFAAKGRWSALIVHFLAAALTAFIIWALT
ncbi:MAG: hypothetical protein K0M78_05910 [Brevundimonas sp.]|nr:hypothetical protein [Brevundimonas sp.]